jgi:hypothetical protein
MSPSGCFSEMRGPAALGYSLMVVLVLLYPDLASSQDRDSACLKTLGEPHRGLQDLLPSQIPGAGHQGAGEIYLSAKGEICRSAVFLSEEEVGVPQAALSRNVRPGKAFLLSAALPGAGQWFLGQDRWPAYLAVEVWAWVRFLDRRREGKDLRSDYKDLAWLVARRVSTGQRTDAGWDYYEALSKYRTSGSFDTDPLVPGIQPEMDPETFNGSIWALAREIFLPEDPETPPTESSEPYQKAYSYYLNRAYGPEFAWDWGTNTLHREEYAALIRDADEALRGSTKMVGVILANHLLSAVDALASGRLGISGQSDPTVSVQLRPGPFLDREVTLHFRFPDPMAGYVR